MSRSNPTNDMKNPSKTWIEYHGGGDKGGTFSYYDKEKLNQDGSRGANVSLGGKLRFMFLDQTYTVTGWNEPSHSGIYANEVKDITNGVMTVKAFKGQESYRGTWNNIKAAVKSMGGKFTVNIYIAAKQSDGSLGISCIQLRGAAFAKWNEFVKVSGKKTLEEGAVKIVSHLDGKKGAVNFKTPVFEMVAEGVTEESNNIAIELDKELQEYLAVKLEPVTTPKEEEMGEPVQIEEPTHNTIPKKKVEPIEELEPVSEAPEADFSDFDDEDDDLPF